MYNYPQFSDFFIFSTVRDPYTRLISSWNEFRKINKHFGWSHGLKICQDLSIFLDTFDKNSSRFSIHFRAQYLQLNNLHKRSVDRIMYYENLGSDFAKITKTLYGEAYYLKSISRGYSKIFLSRDY